MTRRKIYITELDKMRLEELIDVAEEFGDHNRKDIESLSGELERAEIVPSKKVPHNVVTMNSKVVLTDIDSSEEMTFSLVFPKDANIEKGNISILAPVGTAIIGYSEGDIIEWPVPSGVRRIRIKKIIYQPEAAGDYNI